MEFVTRQVTELIISEVGDDEGIEGLTSVVELFEDNGKGIIRITIRELEWEHARELYKTWIEEDKYGR